MLNNQRMGWMRAAVDRLAGWRDQLAANLSQNDPKWQNAANRPSMLFLGPEYMFAQPTLGQFGHIEYDERFIGEVEKNQLVGDMQNVSTRYGKSLILVPGSTAYKKPITLARHQKALTAVNASMAR